MQKDFVIRNFVEQDFPMISSWYFEWRGKYIEREMVSSNGFISSTAHDHIYTPVACCFLFASSNSRNAQIGFPVTNPNKKITSKERLKCLKMAMVACHDLAIGAGAKHVIAVSDNVGIGRIYDKMGFESPTEHRFHHWNRNKPKT